jgi:hypothetical protein
LITGLKEGSYVEPSKLNLADHLKGRLEQWEASKRIGAKTAERYGELINNQIVPHLGAITLQKLTVQDIETWHNNLASTGRQDGKGGLSNRTIGHAHRVLSKALKDASKFDLVVKNVAAAQQPPTAEDEEVVIVQENRIKELQGVRCTQRLFRPLHRCPPQRAPGDALPLSESRPEDVGNLRKSRGDQKTWHSGQAA